MAKRSAIDDDEDDDAPEKPAARERPKTTLDHLLRILSQHEETCVREEFEGNDDEYRAAFEAACKASRINSEVLEDKLTGIPHLTGPEIAVLGKLWGLGDQEQGALQGRVNLAFADQTNTGKPVATDPGKSPAGRATDLIKFIEQAETDVINTRYSKNGSGYFTDLMAACRAAIISDVMLMGKLENPTKKPLNEDDFRVIVRFWRLDEEKTDTFFDLLKAKKAITTDKNTAQEIPGAMPGTVATPMVTGGAKKEDKKKAKKKKKKKPGSDVKAKQTEVSASDGGGSGESTAHSGDDARPVTTDPAQGDDTHHVQGAAGDKPEQSVGSVAAGSVTAGATKGEEDSGVDMDTVTEGMPVDAATKATVQEEPPAAPLAEDAPVIPPGAPVAAAGAAAVILNVADAAGEGTVDSGAAVGAAVSGMVTLFPEAGPVGLIPAPQDAVPEQAEAVPPVDLVDTAEPAAASEADAAEVKPAKTAVRVRKLTIDNAQIEQDRDAATTGFLNGLLQKSGCEDEQELAAKVAQGTGANRRTVLALLRLVKATSETAAHTGSAAVDPADGTPPSEEAPVEGVNEDVSSTAPGSGNRAAAAARDTAQVIAQFAYPDDPAAQRRCEFYLRPFKKGAAWIEPEKAQAELAKCFDEAERGIDVDAMGEQRAVQIAMFVRLLRYASYSRNYKTLAESIAEASPGTDSKQVLEVIYEMGVPEEELVKFAQQAEQPVQSAKNRRYQKTTNTDIATAIARFAYPQDKDAAKACVQFLTSAKYLVNQPRAVAPQHKRLAALAKKTPGKLGFERIVKDNADKLDAEDVESLLRDVEAEYEKLTVYDEQKAAEIGTALIRKLLTEVAPSPPYTNARIAELSRGMLHGEETQITNGTVRNIRVGELTPQFENLTRSVDALAFSLVPEDKPDLAKKTCKLYGGNPLG